MKIAKPPGCLLIVALAATRCFSFAGETNHLSHANELVVEGVLHANSHAYDESIADFSKAIEIAPTNAYALFNRASIYRVKGEFKKSIEDFNKCILLNPTNDLAFKNRASDFAALGEFDKALSDWNESLRLNPHDATALAMRGFCHNNKGEFEEALKDYYQAIQIDSTNSSAWNNLGWLRATCPKDSLRDGKEAVEAATKACKYSNWKNWTRIDTLAAAFAEAGDFQQAIKCQNQALGMHDADEKQNKAMLARLSLYEKEQPFRQAGTSKE